MRKFEVENSSSISSVKNVRVKQMNHVVGVMSLDKESNGFQGIVKLSKTQYCLKSTGEIFEYNISENRSENISGLKSTFRKVRDLINTNFIGSGNELHVTLTYAANMTDTETLHSDFKKFWQKYKRKYGNVDYLSVIEPQGRGAWHCHVLIRHNDRKKVYVPPDELARLWGNGFIKIKSLKGVDNIGAYLSAYLGDIELTDDDTETMKIALRLQNENKLVIKEVEVEGVKKSIIKGGRLHMYPSGMNLYRKSKGIVFPEVLKMSYKDAKKIVGRSNPNYSRTITIYGDDGEVLNRIAYESYNTLRKL